MNTETTSPAPRGMRTFVVIWLGELISILGSGLTGFALGVWIFQQTGQATPFALTVLFSTLPRLLLLPLAGMLADRWNRRWLMILGDTGSAAATLAIVLLLTTGQLEVWMIYLLVIFSSAFTTFQEPAYRSSVVMLVPKKDLARASGMMNASEAVQMLVAPLLAGFLFGVIGLRGIILIDFISYFFAVGALLIVRIPQPQMTHEEAGQKASLRRDTVFAWRYLRERPGLFWLLWYFALVNFLANFAAVLLGPLVLSFAGADAYGLVQVMMGVGMLAGSILIGAWGGPSHRAAGVVAFIALSGAGLLLTGLRASPWVVGAGLFVMMFFIPMAQACSTALNQTKIEPSIQGRLFAVRGLISQSMMPLAFLIAGPLADSVFGPLMLPGGALAGTFLGGLLGVGPGRGIGLMFVFSGVTLILASALAWMHPRIRRIEIELPDVVAQPEAGEAPPAPVQAQAAGQQAD